jgi:hypothetical protein
VHIPTRSARRVGRRSGAVPAQDGPHARGREPHAPGDELPVDAAISPGRVLLGRQGGLRRRLPASSVGPNAGASTSIAVSPDPGANGAGSRAGRRSALGERPTAAGSARRAPLGPLVEQQGGRPGGGEGRVTGDHSPSGQPPVEPSTNHKRASRPRSTGFSRPTRAERR